MNSTLRNFLLSALLIAVPAGGFAGAEVWITGATPPAGSGAGQTRMVAGFPVTDATGRAIPCEQMIRKLRSALAGETPAGGVKDLRARALERCNAGDDAHADAFAAQALSQLKG